MEKPREIPPNAASRDQVASVQRRVEALGVGFHDAVKAAGLGRNLGYRLLRGEGSVGSLRKVEDWLVREEAKRGPRAAEKREANALKEWAELGEALRELDPARFEQFLIGIREIVKAKQTEKSVLVQMFRVNPDFDK